MAAQTTLPTVTPVSFAFNDVQSTPHLDDRPVRSRSASPYLARAPPADFMDPLSPPRMSLPELGLADIDEELPLAGYSQPGGVSPPPYAAAVAPQSWLNGLGDPGLAEEDERLRDHRRQVLARRQELFGMLQDLEREKQELL